MLRTHLHSTRRKHSTNNVHSIHAEKWEKMWPAFDPLCLSACLRGAVCKATEENQICVAWLNVSVGFYLPKNKKMVNGYLLLLLLHARITPWLLSKLGWACVSHRRYSQKKKNKNDRLVVLERGRNYIGEGAWVCVCVQTRARTGRTNKYMHIQ